MSIKIQWLGHASWSIATEKHTILVDPFLNDNPASPVKAGDVAADFILVSHGHDDHVGDVVEIARRTGATVVSNFEISTWLQQKHGVKNTVAMNLGGGIDLPFGRVKMTIAFHSSGLPDGSDGGNPCGFLLTFPTAKIYFACDTALFSDMQLIGTAGLDLAVLPIGDLFTMGPDDALEAVKLLQPKRVVPSHYNTWAPIVQDEQVWAERVRIETMAEPILLQPGETFLL